MEKITKSVFMSMIFVLFLVFLASSVLAQEEGKEVCLVYFTSYGCGDDCGLTDTLMNGLLNEYSEKLTYIIYYVDANQENQNVFEAYRRAYGMPQNVPIVLFGKDDYLQGRNDIYKNSELKILEFLNANGTNCPLESGYIPPQQLGAGSLPGQPEILGKRGNKTDGTDNSQKEVLPGKTDGGIMEQIPFYLTFIEKIDQESLFSAAIVLASVIIVVIVVLLVWRKVETEKITTS